MICESQKDDFCAFCIIKNTQYFSTVKNGIVRKLFTFYYSHPIVRNEEFWISAVKQMMNVYKKNTLDEDVSNDDDKIAALIIGNNLKSMLYCLRSKDQVFLVVRVFVKKNENFDKLEVS